MKGPTTLLLLVLLATACSAPKDELSLDKSGFVQIHEVIPEITYDIRYYGKDNFLGVQVDGYQAPTAYMTKEATQALLKVEKTLNEEGLGLKIFDAYRPQKAVDHFVRWGQVISDTLTKQKYYPEIDKAEVFELGFVAKKSSHTRGSTVDLTIIYQDTKVEMDMGSGFDYFGAISNHDSPLVDSTHTAHRNKLRTLMKAHGFKEYSGEWWHYTFANEPYPSTYFNFNVK